jgi:hypothetical protein
MEKKILLGRILVVCLPMLVFILLGMARVFGQESQINYNDYYRYPLSFGVEYQSLTPFADYGSGYNIFDLSVQVAWPLLKTPLIVPMARIGIMNFDSQDPLDPEKWDHRHYYGIVGLNYTNRFTKNFALGAEAGMGYSQAVFSNLLSDEGNKGLSNLLFEAGARIGLNPSYNFGIDINPNIKYLLSLGPLKDFNGLIFGIGFSAHYRFGQDPDASGTVIRSIRFEEASVMPAFAAMQSFYTKNSIGSITLTNMEKHGIENIEVSFFQAGYMDSPTPSGSIDELGAGESRRVEIYANFNEEVFRIEGVTPLTGEIIVRYTSKERPVEQKKSVSYELHDKTAILWDDDQKVAAFITPADSALRNFASFIRQSCKEEVIDAYTEVMQFGIQMYHALGEVGCLYQADPVSPFAEAQGNPIVVDSISLPRDTLKRITGDCDDLTVLYNSLLETVGIETGFITIPGHIYSAFNTKVPSRMYKKVHPDRGMMINLDGELWVPVEVTLVGRSGFIPAWKRGIEEWQGFDDEGTKRGFYRTRESQALYRPVGLKETDLGLQYPDAKKIEQGFRTEMGEIVELIVADFRDNAASSGKKEDWNKLGIALAKFRQYEKAEEAFHSALEIDPDFTNALVNMGNVDYLKGNYRDALYRFTRVYENLQREGKDQMPIALKVLLNISKANYELRQYDNSKLYFDMAHSINPDKMEKYSYLGNAVNDELRSAQVMEARHDILFAGDDEL